MILEQEKSMDIEDLKERLIFAGINISLWGKGEAKTVKDLYREIKNGETELVKDKELGLIRRVSICGADIFYSSPLGKEFHLVEEKQVFSDGRVRVRDWGHAVSEKIKTGETPKEGVLRGIQEEIGVSGDFEIEELEKDSIQRESLSYPGLISQYDRFHYKVNLNKNQFNPEGYIEKNGSITTFFKWEEM
jgi:hypothetical protein